MIDMTCVDCGKELLQGYMIHEECWEEILTGLKIQKAEIKKLNNTLAGAEASHKALETLYYQIRDEELPAAKNEIERLKRIELAMKCLAMDDCAIARPHIVCNHYCVSCMKEFAKQALKQETEK